jgi:hypothetical protein
VLDNSIAGTTEWLTLAVWRVLYVGPETGQCAECMFEAKGNLNFKNIKRKFEKSMIFYG